MEKDEHLLGKEMILGCDANCYGGREVITLQVKAGTRVKVVTIGFVQVEVEVVDCPFGSVSWWTHSSSLRPVENTQ